MRWWLICGATVIGGVALCLEAWHITTSNTRNGSLSSSTSASTDAPLISGPSMDLMYGPSVIPSLLTLTTSWRTLPTLALISILFLSSQLALLCASYRRQAAANTNANRSSVTDTSLNNSSSISPCYSASGAADNNINASISASSSSSSSIPLTSQSSGGNSSSDSGVTTPASGARALRKAEAVLAHRSDSLMVVLERPVNAFNVAAIMRTLDCLGVQVSDDSLTSLSPSTQCINAQIIIVDNVNVNQ
jgi:hypothetical protein